MPIHIKNLDIKITEDFSERKNQGITSFSTQNTPRHSLLTLNIFLFNEKQNENFEIMT